MHLPASTATPTPMVDESMADEFKIEESTADNTIPWRMVYMYVELYIRTYIRYTYVHKLRNIEIPEKKKRV